MGASVEFSHNMDSKITESYL